MLVRFGILLLLILINKSESRTYYVRSDTGSNSNDGLSPSTAFATLAYAATSLSPGDEVDAMGTFNNNNYGSGRYTNRPSVMTIGTSNVTIRGNGASVLRYDGASGITISGGTNFVEIIGFEIEGPAAQINYTMAIANRFRNSTTEAKNFYSNRGIVGWGPSHHITVRDCYVHDTCASGIRFNDADYITIEDCVVTRTSYWSSAAESAIVMAESFAIDNSTDIKMIFRRNALFENWNRIPFYQPSHDGLSAYPDYGEASQNYILDGQGLYVTRSDDHYKGTFLFENNIVASSGKNGINFDGTPSGGAIVRYNTLYRNGAFDFIQTEHVGPNKVAGVAAKHVGFLNVYNNVIVCRGDEYSAFSVWDASPTDVQHNMLVNCSVQLASGDANRTSTTSSVFRDGSETYVTRQDLETRFELKSLGIDIASSAYISSEDFRGTSRPYGNGYDMGAIESSRCVIPDTDTLKTYVEEVNNGTQYEISDPVCAVKDISDWITDDVTSLEDVFRSMNQIGNVDLSRWNVAKVTTMFYTFYDATSFNGNLSNWNTNKVKNLAQTFRGATAFKGTGLKDWNTASVTTLESTFRSSGLTEDVGVWNVENARSIARTFYNARDFHSDTIGSWNVQNVNTLMSTFRGASSFNGDLSSWSVTSTLTNMQHTFRDASLFEGDGIGSWDTSSVTVMKYAFEGAAQFNGDIESWDVENVTNFNYMFENAMSFDRNISVWNVNAGSSTTLMFDGDVGLSECVRANIYDAWFERGVEILSFATSSCTSPTTTTTTTEAATTTSTEAATTTTSTEAATTTSTEAATTTTSTEAATTTSTEALSTTSTEPVSTTSTEVVSTTSTEDVSTTSTEDVSTTSTEAVSTTSTEAVSTTSTEAVSTTSTEAVSTTSTEVATTTSTEAATTTGTEAISTTSTEAVSTTSSIVTESESSEDTIMVAIGMYAGIGIGALLLMCLSYLCFCSTKREKKTIHTPTKKGSFDGDSNLWATHNSDNDILAAPYEL